MRNEYGSVEGEFKNVRELHQPKENLGHIGSEFLESSNEYWKKTTEYVEEMQTKEISSAEKEAQEKKKKEKKRRQKVLNKMVYGVASAAMVVTISQTAEPPQYSGDTIIFDGVGVLTEEQVNEKLEANPPSGSFRVIVGEGYTEIGQDAFDDMDDLIAISLPGSLDKIGESALANCRNLSEVIIPEGVTEIGGNAFSGCSGITELTMPDSVTTIGSSAFWGCKQVVFDKVTTSGRSIGYAAFCGVTIKELVISESYNPMSNRVLYQANVENVSFEEGIRRIPNDALNGCSTFTKLEIPDSVTEIGGNAFSGCSGITELTMPDSVTTIGSSAFWGCKQVVFDKLTTSGRSIGYAAFCEVTIKELVISESYNPMSNRVLYHANVENVSFEEGIRRIPNDALNGCSTFTKLEIPDSVTEIGGNAFSGCSGITELTMPDSVTTIGSSAFWGCKQVEFDKLTTSGRSIGYAAFCEVTIKELVISESYNPMSNRVLYHANVENVSFEEGIRRIPDDALNGCSTFTKLEIPDSVTEIGGNAFSGCSGITELTMPDSVTTIGSSAFWGCKQVVFDKLTTSGRSIGYAAFCEVTIKELVISESYNPMSSRVLYHANVENVSFEEGICRIPDDALNGCSTSTKLEIPEGVTEIGSGAFSGCKGITELSIPDSVTTIEAGAFRNCENLVIITSEGSVAEKYAIEEEIPYVIR